MTSPTRGERRIPLDITTTRSDASGDLPPLSAYAFSSGGALLDAQPVDEKGNAKLSIPVSKEGDAVRVVLGPQVEKDELDVGEVLRRGGIDSHLQVRPNLEQLPPLRFDLTPDLIRPWLGRRCVVKGTLYKRVITGGLPVNLPVCNAAVDIWEVDPWPRIIIHLPDLELDRLRQIIDGPWPPRDWPVQRPIEDLLRGLQPGVVPDPVGPVALNPQPLPPRTMQRVATRSVAMASRSEAAPAELASLTVPADLQVAVRAARPAFERAVIANIDLLRPILCWLYPMRVRKTKIAAAFTDECGHFRTVIWRSIFDTDIPDLYFTARQRLWNGFWITIYEPTPLACNTYWNYQCGTEVTLITRHPFAHACLPCPPVIAPRNWVLFKAIGNTSVWGIHGANTATKQGSVGFDAAKHGLLGDTSPWGGVLRPRIEFDNSLRTDLGVRYYRVSFKRAEEPASAWRDSTETISRHYVQTIAGQPVSSQYPLGPNLVGTTEHLYEIPPALPPVGQWSPGNLVLEFQSAVFDTASLAPGSGYNADGSPNANPSNIGLWQIRLELFDGAGNQVDPAAIGTSFYVPSVTDLSGPIPTENAASLGLVNVADKCMILTVQVDNNRCYATIGAPTIDGVPASPGCGVMNYANLSQVVRLPYDALERNRYADHHFYVQRGEGPTPRVDVPNQQANVALGSTPVPTDTVGHLLDGCSIAGFSEVLNVYHRATDGWSRLSGYDATAVRAFVLAPPGVATM